MHQGERGGTGRGNSPIPAGRFALLLAAGAIVTIFIVLLIHR
jgi:hypothetical protein